MVCEIRQEYDINDKLTIDITNITYIIALPILTLVEIRVYGVCPVIMEEWLIAISMLSVSRPHRPDTIIHLAPHYFASVRYRRRITTRHLVRQHCLHACSSSPYCIVVQSVKRVLVPLLLKAKRDNPP